MNPKRPLKVKAKAAEAVAPNSPAHTGIAGMNNEVASPKLTRNFSDIGVLVPSVFHRVYHRSLPTAHRYRHFVGDQ